MQTQSLTTPNWMSTRAFAFRWATDSPKTASTVASALASPSLLSSSEAVLGSNVDGICGSVTSHFRDIHSSQLQ
jgi:hypothetical protein